MLSIYFIPKCLVGCLRETKKSSNSAYVIANRDGKPLAESRFMRVWQHVRERSTKERAYCTYINGQGIRHPIKLEFGESPVKHNWIHKFRLKFTRSLRYTIRVKVGEFMGQCETDLKRFTNQFNGILKTSEAMDAGFSKESFYNFVKEQHLEKIGRGIYIAPETWADEMYLLHNFILKGGMDRINKT